MKCIEDEIRNVMNRSAIVQSSIDSPLNIESENSPIAEVDFHVSSLTSIIDNVSLRE